MTRWCEFCRVVELTGRMDQRTCGRKCRQAMARFKRHMQSRLRAAVPLEIAYGDPPYPGKAQLYEDEPTYQGEVDHRELLRQLQLRPGWALSTDEEGLRIIEPMLVGVEHRKAVWVRGARPGPCWGPATSWECVLYRPARTELSRTPAVDSLVYTARARTADPGHLIGAKPAAFWMWLFDLVGARPGDRFTDLFPGSGGGYRAWAAFEEKAAA